MIQANELSIGNYIYDDFNEVHIVEKIESQKFNDWNGSDTSLVVFSKLSKDDKGMYTCDVVSPIPLTEEWLLKFGFEKKRDFFHLDYESFCIFLDKKGYYTHINCGNLYIKHVHQLQNLYFALTGKELV